MKYFEFGKENETLMVILHGGLAGEHPEQFVREVSATHEKSLAGKSEEK